MCGEECPGRWGVGLSTPGRRHAQCERWARLARGVLSCASLLNPGLPRGFLDVCLFLLDASFSEWRA